MMLNFSANYFYVFNRLVVAALVDLIRYKPIQMKSIGMVKALRALGIYLFIYLFLPHQFHNILKLFYTIQRI